MADEPTDPATEPEPVDPAEEPEIDYKAEYERVKREARKHEDRAKEGAAARKRLAELEAANQTESERLQATAKAAEERAAAAEQRAASALIRSTLVDAGYTSDHAAALIEDMNVGRYIGEDGQVDTDAVTAKYGPLAPAAGPRAPRPNAAQGNGTPNRTLTELISDAEKARDPKKSMQLKARQLVQQQRQQG